MNITTIFQALDYDMSRIKITPYLKSPNDHVLDSYLALIIKEPAVLMIFDKHTSEVIYIYINEDNYWYTKSWEDVPGCVRLSEQEIIDKLYSLLGKEPDVSFPIDGVTTEELAVLDDCAANLDLTRNSYLVKIIIESTAKTISKELKK